MCEIDEYDEVDQYIESLIIFGNELTDYGLELYSEEIYIKDEEGNETMIRKEDYSKKE